MNDDTNQVLTRAYDLIESEHLDEAKSLLDPILEREGDNADAWWLYAHAVSDVETARRALQNVLRIDPDYPEADDLLKMLEDSLTPAPSALRPIQRLDTSRPPVAPPDLPPTLPEKVDETWDFEEVAEGKPAARRLLTPRQLVILIPILVVVLVGGLLLILNSANTTTTTTLPSPTALGQAAVPTLPVTDFTPIPLDTIVPSDVTEVATSASAAEETPAPAFTRTPIPTNEQPPTPDVQSAGDVYQPLYDALSSFTMPRNGVEVTSTSLGDTLLVSVCTLAGPELRAALPQVMNAIAGISQSLAIDVDAVGARMLNCANNTTLLVIGVPHADAVAYANGDLNDEEFQARWSSQ